MKPKQADAQRRVFFKQSLSAWLTASLLGVGVNGWANPPKPKAKSGNKMVRLETSAGVIDIELFADKAPKTVANFLEYVNSGHYSNTIFHRVINGFMIQGGGMEPGMKEKRAGKTVENEANNGLKNDRYTLAMARTSDPHSASAQFFINVVDNDFLNHRNPTAQGWGYCVFGQVVNGKEVVEAIKGVKTSSKGFHQDVPVEDIIITKASVIE
jgi:peptidyl-prolyl cis-trans isomerase B (cyclophilin B)